MGTDALPPLDVNVSVRISCFATTPLKVSDCCPLTASVPFPGETATAASEDFTDQVRGLPPEFITLSRGKSVPAQENHVFGIGAPWMVKTGGGGGAPTWIITLSFPTVLGLLATCRLIVYVLAVANV
jgi:hypothetical protein